MINSNPQFFKQSDDQLIDCVSESLYANHLSGGPSYGNYQPVYIYSLSQSHSSVYFRLKIVAKTDRTYSATWEKC